MQPKIHLKIMYFGMDRYLADSHLTFWKTIYGNIMCVKVIKFGW